MIGQYGVKVRTNPALINPTLQPAAGSSNSPGMAVAARIALVAESHFSRNDFWGNDATSIDIPTLYKNAAEKVSRKPNAHILLYLENRFAAAAYAVLLEKQGFTVTMTSGTEGCRRALSLLLRASTAFDAVLLEWEALNSPDMRGRDVVYLYNHQRPEFPVVFIALTTQSYPPSLAIRGGADLFLRLPIILHIPTLRRLLLPNASSALAFPAQLLASPPRFKLINDELGGLSLRAARMNDEDLQSMAADFRKRANETESGGMLSEVEASLLLDNISKLVVPTGKFKARVHREDRRSGSRSSSNSSGGRSSGSDSGCNGSSSGLDDESNTNHNGSSGDAVSAGARKDKRSTSKKEATKSSKNNSAADGKNRTKKHHHHHHRHHHRRKRDDAGSEGRSRSKSSSPAPHYEIDIKFLEGVVSAAQSMKVRFEETARENQILRRFVRRVVDITPRPVDPTEIPGRRRRAAHNNNKLTNNYGSGADAVSDARGGDGGGDNNNSNNNDEDQDGDDEADRDILLQVAKDMAVQKWMMSSDVNAATTSQLPLTVLAALSRYSNEVAHLPFLSAPALASSSPSLIPPPLIHPQKQLQQQQQTHSSSPGRQHPSEPVGELSHAVMESWPKGKIVDHVLKLQDRLFRAQADLDQMQLSFRSVKSLEDAILRVSGQMAAAEGSKAGAVAMQNNVLYQLGAAGSGAKGHSNSGSLSSTPRSAALNMLPHGTSNNNYNTSQPLNIMRGPTQAQLRAAVTVAEKRKRRKENVAKGFRTLHEKLEEQLMFAEDSASKVLQRSTSVSPAVFRHRWRGDRGLVSPSFLAAFDSMSTIADSLCTILNDLAVRITVKFPPAHDKFAEAAAAFARVAGAVRWDTTLCQTSSSSPAMSFSLRVDDDSSGGGPSPLMKRGASFAHLAKKITDDVKRNNTNGSGGPRAGTISALDAKHARKVLLVRSMRLVALVRNQVTARCLMQIWAKWASQHAAVRKETDAERIGRERELLREESMRLQNNLEMASRKLSEIRLSTEKRMRAASSTNKKGASSNGDDEGELAHFAKMLVSLGADVAAVAAAAAPVAAESSPGGTTSTPPRARNSPHSSSRRGQQQQQLDQQDQQQQQQQHSSRRGRKGANKNKNVSPLPPAGGGGAALSPGAAARIAAAAAPTTTAAGKAVPLRGKDITVPQAVKVVIADKNDVLKVAVGAASAKSGGPRAPAILRQQQQQRAIGEADADRELPASSARRPTIIGFADGGGCGATAPSPGEQRQRHETRPSPSIRVDAVAAAKIEHIRKKALLLADTEEFGDNVASLDGSRDASSSFAPASSTGDETENNDDGGDAPAAASGVTSKNRGAGGAVDADADPRPWAERSEIVFSDESPLSQQQQQQQQHPRKDSSTSDGDPPSQRQQQHRRASASVSGGRMISEVPITRAKVEALVERLYRTSPSPREMERRKHLEEEQRQRRELLLASQRPSQPQAQYFATDLQQSRRTMIDLADALHPHPLGTAAAASSSSSLPAGVLDSVTRANIGSTGRVPVTTSTSPVLIQQHQQQQLPQLLLHPSNSANSGIGIGSSQNSTNRHGVPSPRLAAMLSQSSSGSVSPQRMVPTKQPPTLPPIKQQQQQVSPMQQPRQSIIVGSPFAPSASSLSARVAGTSANINAASSSPSASSRIVLQPKVFSPGQ